MKLNSVVPWGRTLAEYRLMFDLSEADLGKRILGCGDGPASFNAEMTALGHTVTSLDPIYQFTAEQIEQRVQATYEPIISQVRQNAHRYCWDTFPDADALGQARLSAMQTFLQDYATGKAAGRYRNQALPTLDLPDNAYDLCVCSHLLFLYSDQLSLGFHLASLQALLRVAREVRIFPLLTLDCQPSPYLDAVRQAMAEQGHAVQIQAVGYEFQKGGNEMLRIEGSGRVEG
ncbi:MAG: SAM-dependent methyltransferase [Cyanobacteria bacterium J06636_16]